MAWVCDRFATHTAFLISLPSLFGRQWHRSESQSQPLTSLSFSLIFNLEIVLWKLNMISWLLYAPAAPLSLASSWVASCHCQHWVLWAALMAHTHVHGQLTAKYPSRGVCMVQNLQVGYYSFACVWKTEAWRDGRMSRRRWNPACRLTAGCAMVSKTRRCDAWSMLYPFAIATEKVLFMVFLPILIGQMKSHLSGFLDEYLLGCVYCLCRWL